MNPAGFWDEQVLPRAVEVVCGAGPVDRLRGPVCAGLHGQVVEIGFGSGHNVPHYPDAVRRVTAVEPSDLAWRRAQGRIAARGVPVLRGGLDGQRLDLPDDSFDCALSTFTLCTIPDLDAALAELRRVLRPGGELHFVEHGLAPDRAVETWQHRLTPVWSRVAGGCHLDRPIAAHLERAGFTLVDVERFYGMRPRTFAYFYRGRATTAG